MGQYKPLFMVMILSLFSIIFMAAIIIYTGKSYYRYLTWNLFLAWVPMFFSYLLYHRLNYPAQRLQNWKFWGMTILWLLFFPNAPYLITDLIHMNERQVPGEWGDAMLLFTFALCGLATGINSLMIMHMNFVKRFPKHVAYLLIGGSIVLSGYGVFLGRVQRWNSWDIFVRPQDLFMDIVVHLQNPTAIFMTVSFSLLMGMVYMMTLTMMRSSNNS